MKNTKREKYDAIGTRLRMTSRKYKLIEGEMTWPCTEYKTWNIIQLHFISLLSLPISSSSKCYHKLICNILVIILLLYYSNWLRYYISLNLFIHNVLSRAVSPFIFSFYMLLETGNWICRCRIDSTLNEILLWVTANITTIKPIFGIPVIHS